MWTTDADEIDRLIERITHLLNGNDILDTHSFSEHSPQCPSEKIDIFKELDAKRKIEFHKNKM